MVECQICLDVRGDSRPRRGGNEIMTAGIVKLVGGQVPLGMTRRLRLNSAPPRWNGWLFDRWVGRRGELRRSEMSDGKQQRGRRCAGDK